MWNLMCDLGDAAWQAVLAAWISRAYTCKIINVKHTFSFEDEDSLSDTVVHAALSAHKYSRYLWSCDCKHCSRPFHTLKGPGI